MMVGTAYFLKCCFLAICEVRYMFIRAAGRWRMSDTTWFTSSSFWIVDRQQQALVQNIFKSVFLKKVLRYLLDSMKHIAVYVELKQESTRGVL